MAVLGTSDRFGLVLDTGLTDQFPKADCRAGGENEVVAVAVDQAGSRKGV
jgi:hypothetical protein